MVSEVLRTPTDVGLKLLCVIWNTLSLFSVLNNSWPISMPSYSSFLFGSCYIMEILDLYIKGGGTARRLLEFGQTYVVKPKGEHLATIVWLHGLGDNGSR